MRSCNAIRVHSCNTCTQCVLHVIRKYCTYCKLHCTTVDIDVSVCSAESIHGLKELEHEHRKAALLEHGAQLLLTHVHSAHIDRYKECTEAECRTRDSEREQRWEK